MAVYTKNIVEWDIADDYKYRPVAKCRHMIGTVVAIGTLDHVISTPGEVRHNCERLLSDQT